ncbi:MAG TPA: hypothetical protein VFJ16_32265 [Longimicrobium sp.]|nr:hypothetical protein [Longimicrobium sp.]
MKKLVLNVDVLRVDSFVADAARESRGTVHAESTIIQPTAWTYCIPCGSESSTCEPSGGYTCTRPAVCGPAQTT